MMDSEKRCPDCGVSMEAMKLRTEGYSSKLSLITNESRGGLFGSLGMKERLDVSPYVCPECMLTRLYASP